jgi:glycosyltransferase involved in cell wall biosynthesis
LINNSQIRSEGPLISVVIPCYKAEKYIARAIDSALAQPHVDVEIIVVEDGVFDDTKSIVSLYGDKVKFLSFKQNRGAPVARNAGLEEVSSEYVMFLDADDFLEGELLKGLYDTLQMENVSVAFGACIKRWEGKNRESIFIPPKNQTHLQVVERWLKGNSGPGTCSILWRTSEVIRIGGWNTDIIRNQDGELIIRAMLSGCNAGVSERGAGIYWHHKNESVSKNMVPVSFQSQEIIDAFVQKWLDENGYPEEVSSALNQFRFKTALDAYRNSLDDIGRYWEDKWKKGGGQPIILEGGMKNTIIYKLVARMSYSFLGYRKGELFITWLRKLMNY